MSLVAWYKLDGNALDSSGNGNHGTASNVSWVDGKIVQAASFSGNGRIVTSSATCELSYDDFSISVWIKPGTSTINWQRIFGKKAQAAAAAGYSIYLNGNNGQLLWSTANGSTGNEYWTTNSLTFGVWHHVVMIRSRTDARIGYFYVDGSRWDISTIPSILNVATSTPATLGALDTGALPYTGIVDDVRIYDHALSEKEIKELSQAKVLHYDFDEFQEPTENLLALAGADASLERSGTTGTYNYWSVDITSQVLSRWSPTNSNFTMQFEGKRSEGDTYPQMYVHFTDWSWATAFNILHLNWSRNSYTFTMPDPTGKRVYMGIYNMPSSGTGTSYSRNHQVEQKDHATPFVNGTRTGRVSDISGYDNHADLALATTPQWTSDSRIGKGAYKFDGSGTGDGTIQGSNIDVDVNITNTNNYPDGCTYSFWVKADTDAVDRMSLFYGGSTINHIEIYSSSKYFRTEAATQNGYSFGSGVFPDDVRGQWAHFSIVFANRESGRPVRWYQNGNLFYTGSMDGGTNPGGEYFSFSKIARSTGSGSYTYAPSFKGYIDDVRIYATALSADDIKELYQTRAQLDNRGNFFLSQINQPAIVTDGLVGWWPLAGDTKDYSGYANDGVNNGAVSTTGVNGEADTAYLFTEWTDYIQLPANPSLVKSISFWLKEDAVTDWLPFVGQSNSYYLMATGGGTGAFYHSSAGSPLIYRDAQSTLYPAGDIAWHHYVATNLDISTWTIIKLSGYGTTNWPLEGKVADVRFYSRNLSEGEIQLLYKKGLDLL